jgi:cell wall-associated NlpC family hydrolase
VRYVFAQHGIALPRTAHEQAAFGDSPFPANALEPGDLLFFAGGQGAQHIAIFVGGDTLIHASSRAHRIVMERAVGFRTGRTWFGKRLIAVRRLLPMDGIIQID